MTIKFPTKCCSLTQMSAWNITTLDAIKTFVENQKKESEKMKAVRQGFGVAVTIQTMGERAIFCITTAQESNLEKNLNAAGFKYITSFKRRFCYPEKDNDLKMWMINW